MTQFCSLLMTCCLMAFATSVLCEQEKPQHQHHHNKHNMQHKSGHAHKAHGPNTHAPIGVMGDHIHAKGQFMMSYRYMKMHMQGNQFGSATVSSTDIVNQFNNRFSPPTTLRVVPEKMETNMHMLGLMYAPSDTLTLMGMVAHTEKSMLHTTFSGMSGANVLGQFETQVSGMGDTHLSALYSLFQSKQHAVHANVGLSLPTGSIVQLDTVLTPMNSQRELRLPYAMQLGSGTYDIEVGTTYNYYANKLNIGAQAKYKVRTGGNNSQGYQLGNKTSLTTWLGYNVSQSVSISGRVTWSHTDSISGIDSNISAPIQTANPDNYGGKMTQVGLGVNYMGHHGVLRGHRFAFEYLTTQSQQANGLQLSSDNMWVLGYQLGF